MSISSPFIHRPVATTLLTIAIALAGAVAFQVLPVSALPQIDFPTISVAASLPGASPEIMASSVATPLERQFGRIAGVTEMTSSSFLGTTSITLQFDLNRNIDGAARDVEASINAAKGQITDGQTTSDIVANDQLLKANYYKDLVVGYHNGAAVKLSDVADVQDSVENIRATGFLNGKPCILLIVFRQPGANIIDTVDRIRDAIPSLKASLPSAIDFTIVLDRTTTIRASVADVERTLAISIALVILVVFLFLRNVRATLIPSVAVPVSLIGTFGVMYLCHYSIDNLSLMALTIATGFVVDDAIVVIENISRYLEQGMSPMESALKGAQEIGFTVLSISISLVAVFIPILLMGGIIGRLFREFAVTLSVAILVSLAISLTTTPMMCSRLLKNHEGEKHGRLYNLSEKFFEGLLSFYERTLTWVLEHHGLTLP